MCGPLPAAAELPWRAFVQQTVVCRWFAVLTSGCGSIGGAVRIGSDDTANNLGQTVSLPTMGIKQSIAVVGSDCKCSGPGGPES